MPGIKKQNDGVARMKKAKEIRARYAATDRLNAAAGASGARVKKVARRSPNRPLAVGREAVTKRMNAVAASYGRTTPKSARSISGEYRGRNQPRRQPAKPAKGLSRAMKKTQRGTKPWN